MAALAAFAFNEIESYTFQAKLNRHNSQALSAVHTWKDYCGVAGNFRMRYAYNIAMKSTRQSFCSQLLFRILLTIINKNNVRSGRVWSGADRYAPVRLLVSPVPWTC